MNEAEYNYIKANSHLLGNVRWSSEQANIMFGMFNRITGKSDPITSCGRCVANVKHRLKFEYEKINSRMEG